MEDTCYFCGAENAQYARREDGGTKQYFPACEKCARKPYSHSEQLEEK